MNTRFTVLYLLLILISLLTTAETILAQNRSITYKIEGIIADSVSQKPLEFVTLNLLTNKQIAVKAGFTRPDGSFTLSGLKAGNYFLMVTGVGYHPKTLAINLTDSTNTSRNVGTITIRAQTIGLKEVTVKAAKPIIRQEIDRISYDLQADPESKVSNVLDMMRKVPYLSVDANENVLLKGNSSYRILVNGKPSSMMERSYKDILRSMPASSIQRIEVITIPPANYEAEGLAGIINIITNKKVVDGYTGSLNISERFPVGGPGVGGSFSAKLGKVGLSAFGGVSSYNTPQTRNSLNRLSRDSSAANLVQNGTRQSDSKSGYIGLEVSYEVNSLNLISGQVNLNGSRSTGASNLQSLLSSGGGALQGYQLANANRSRGNGIDAGLNYQLGFKADKNRLLTASYRYYRFGDEQNTDLNLSNRIHYDAADYRQANNSGSSEQTFQLDYVHPIKKLTVEAGVKGIFRDNQSNFQYRSLNSETGQFEINSLLSNDFTNDQDVLSVYNTYQFTVKGWGGKAGVRLEQTHVDADFRSTDSHVNQRYTNVIPSIALNRKLSETSNLTLGYSRRIKRPGIQKLNPFVDRSNPAVESSGNPNLRPVLSDRIQLGYGFSGKLSLNLGLDYTFIKNFDQRIYSFDPVTNVTRTTLQNTGKGSAITQSISLNYPVTKQWNLSLNATGTYIWIEGMVNNVLLKKELLMTSVTASSSYRFTNGWRLNANLNLVSPNLVWLQATTNGLLGSSFSVSKVMVKDRLSLAASTNNPFTKYRMNRTETVGPNFFETNVNRDYFRSFTFSLTYNFGKLKEAIKKNKRGIKNDDV